MVQKLFTLGQVESRRLIWIIGLLFALIFVLQYFELPYGIFLSTLGSTPVQGKSSLHDGDSPSTSETAHNTPLSSDLNYTSADINQEKKLNETSSGSEENGAATDESLGLDDDDDDTGRSDSSSEKEQKSTLRTEKVNSVDDVLEQEEAREPEQSFNGNINATYNNNSSTEIVGNETRIMTSDHDGSLDAGSPSPLPATPQASLPPYTSETLLDKNASAQAPAIDGNSNTSLVEKERTTNNVENGRSDGAQDDLSLSRNMSPVNTFPKKQPAIPVKDVYSLSDMNELLIQSRESYYSVIPKWSSAVDRELHNAALQIENAPIVDNDPNLYAPIYRNVSMFKRSYELMENTLKVYVYREGERPILHTPVLKGIYASEGWFMKQLEGNKKFVTRDARKAHMFYLPFSSRMLEEKLYVVDSHSHKNLIQYLKNYVDLIAAKYPYWNRTGGADHFLVACHDWAPSETRKLMAKCVRALCNSDVKEGFVFGKDVSLPETYILLPKNPLRDLGGKPLSKKPTLAFFAGSMHGYLRPILLQHWENKDPDIKVFGKLPKSKGNKNYANYMKSSKYCICAKGYEVNSPRVVEAIFYECVPVIISDNFVPPFFEVLNWESFAVFVLEKDIPDLKNILLSIPEKRYKQMQKMVKRVQQHFLWHTKPEKYDIFHMILHSIWYNRLHQIRSDN